jgi:methanogenic corrinoid protein MtbC1
VTDDLLSAGAAARRLGVAVTTLRSWHQRYGLGPSAHAPGRHRRYTAMDIARLILMQQLVTAGVAPSEAARWARRSPLSESSPVPGSAGPGPQLPTATETGERPDLPGTTRGGGGYALALGDAEKAARGLGRAALRLDVLGVRDLVASAIAERGVVHAWDQVLRPVLRAVGDRAAAAQEMVEVEHILSGCISAVFASLPRPPHDTPVRLLLACADEEQHSLPIEALGAALSMRGTPSRLLGARVPPKALRATIRRTGPVAVMIWAQMRSTADPTQLVDLLTGHGRPALVAPAGPGWDRETLPAGVVVPADLAEAVSIFGAAAA